MAYNKLSSFDVRGRLSSSTQGMAVGSFEIMPEPTEYEFGLVVQYLGETADGFVANHLYRCVSNEGVYSWRDVTPTIDPIFNPDVVMGTNAQGMLSPTTITIGELNTLDGVTDNVQQQIDDAKATITDGLNGKVDKVTGKQLSTEDFTTREQEKLSSIAFGAQVNNIEEIQVNDITVQPVDRIVNLSMMEGHSYPIGNLVAGEGVAVNHQINYVIFSIQVRDGAGNVLKGDLKVDDTIATFVPESDAQDCTMYIICGGI